MIAAGTYKARALSFTPGRSEKKGSPFVEVEFGITEPGHTSETIRHRLYFSSEDCSQYSFQALENAGWDGLDLETMKGLGSVECELVITIEEFQGRSGDTRTAPKVRWINKPGEGGARGAPPVTAEEGASILSQLRAMRVATGGKVAPPAPPPPREAGADDDIPF